jgi:hypothetical protein
MVVATAEVKAATKQMAVGNLSELPGHVFEPV